MRFLPTPLPGAYLVEAERNADERGFFARTYCSEEFAKQGLVAQFAQCSISFNARAGTLRGLHYQAAPHGETKLVRVTQGAVFDVIVDLRPGSPAFKRWFATELSAGNRRALYIPEGCAHGFQTLVDSAEILYQITPSYVAAAARGVRWDDPAFAIEWPAAARRVMSERDRSYPDFKP